jgi:N-methylhydantoinase B/oxoprolinase/acetone carboxylase alpha subunit
VERGRSGSAECGPGKAGVSGVHVHMTNSSNTPAEVLDTRTLCGFGGTRCGRKAVGMENIAVGTGSYARLKCWPTVKSRFLPSGVPVGLGGWPGVATVRQGPHGDSPR